ncbi:unnamed protein product [Cylicostephanus goldi]|uniref:SCP domain-containing protein n=1 Tax=Cylicostephanus goldi TaxID=71465 RepID=A0A3P6RZT9_CYLGO|nr:unnamed protein product [Cylicostephanus goldi]
MRMRLSYQQVTRSSTLNENIIALAKALKKTDGTEITQKNSTEIVENKKENLKDISPTWIGMPRYGNRTMCPNVSGMTDEVRKRFLDAHNRYRSALARGLVEWGNGTKVPAAADMVRLRYNCELEIYAFSYASTCSMEYSDLESRVHTGENVGTVLEENADTFEKAVIVVRFKDEAS